MEPQIPYTHKKSKRARHIRLAVHYDGRVVVTTPFGVPPSLIEKFITAKSQWVADKLKLFKTFKINPARKFSRKDYLDNKDKALAFVKDRVNFYNQKLGFSFNKISIKNQKSRWGSCSSKKNLNINYKILFLTKEQQDYIIVHELCHLKEFNHSKNFWSLVEKIIPNYLAIKKSLRHLQLPPSSQV